MERKELFEWAKEIYGAEPDYPWSDWNCVLRHKNNKKWFALVAIYSQWRYFNHWAYDAAAILNTENRSWFILALSRLALLSGKNPFLFKGELRKIRLVSNRLGYEPCPEPDEEVEQHITLNAEGQVWFSSYVFGQRRDGRYEKAHSQNLRIDKAVADRIISAFTEYFSNGYDEVFTTDIGNWNMELTNTAGKVYKFSGSLCSSFEVDGIDLSDLLRDSLKILSGIWL